MMVALTYDAARAAGVAAAATTVGAPATVPQKSWLARLYDAMIEARLQQARRDIRMYTRLMPYMIDEQGNRKLKTEMNDVPFGGW